jgi:hypothetical protein
MELSDSLHALDTIKVHEIYFCLLLYLGTSQSNIVRYEYGLGMMGAHC